MTTSQTILVDVDPSDPSKIDLQDLGGVVASICDFNGVDIMKVMITAFEHANYHTLCTFLNEHKASLLGYDGKQIIIADEALLRLRMLVSAIAEGTAESSPHTRMLRYAEAETFLDRAKKAIAIAKTLEDKGYFS